MVSVKVSTLILWMFYILDQPTESYVVNSYIKELCNMGYLEVAEKTKLQLTEKGNIHLQNILDNKL